MAFATPAASALGNVGASAATAGTASSVLSAIGTGIGAAGRYEQGAYGAQVAKNDAQIARQNATNAITEGNAQVEEEGFRNAAVAGHIRATQAAGNVDVNSGSAVDVQASQAASGRFDEENIQHNALQLAYGYNIQSESQQAQAKQDQSAGTFGALSSLFSNAQALGFKWGVPNKSGLASITKTPGANQFMTNTETLY